MNFSPIDMKQWYRVQTFMYFSQKKKLRSVMLHSLMYVYFDFNIKGSECIPMYSLFDIDFFLSDNSVFLFSNLIIFSQIYHILL